MDVILHVGAHRTATTTFQHHIAANRPALRASRAAYWGPKVVRGGLFRTMSGGTDPILPWQAKRAARRAALRVEALRQDGIKRLIVSDENMLGNLRNVLEETLLYPGAGARIAEFSKGFQKHNLTVGLGIRCYSHWWTSALAFRLMRGGPLPRAGLRECMVTQPRRWRHIIEEIAGAVPNARLVVWTHEAMSSAPHLQLHALAGIVTDAVSLPVLNAAPRGADLRRFMADCGLNADEFAWPDNRFLPFEMHEADALRAQYQNDLTWLAEGAGGLAEYIDATPAEIGAQTVEGKGLSDDGEHRYLA